MFELGVEAEFCAAHALRDYDGKCARVHGHNFRVRLTVRGESLQSNGLLVDFTDLKRELRAVCEELDHQFLNELPPFLIENPTAENLARHIWGEMKRRLQDDPLASLHQVVVYEKDGQYGAYWE
jgi:6-pyruvoyltetrahydropterin/6-carboxytetrahydropterin synthase